MRNTKIVMAAAILAGCGQTEETQDSSALEQADVGQACNYTQAFGNQTNSGIACPELHGMRVVGRLLQDIDAAKENAASGFLQIHESAPLTSGNWLIVPSVEGFTKRATRNTQHYFVQAYRTSLRQGTMPVPVWTAKSEWQPIDGIVPTSGLWTNGYVAQFGPLIANGSVYMPERFGRVSRVNLATGAVTAVIDPLAGTPFSGDVRTLVNNTLASDQFGNVWYTINAFPVENNISIPPRGSWLVRVKPDNTFTLTPWASIASQAVGVPGPNDLCEWPFGTAGSPGPTGPDSKPQMFKCGLQRPGMNAKVAIRPNGNPVVFSYANNQLSAAFLIELNAATLAPIKSYDTRNSMLHGCGIRLTLEDEPDCDIITAGGTVNIGNDPRYNGPVRYQGLDLMDGSPVVAPNGDLTISGYTGGFQFGGGLDGRGGMVTFHADGSAPSPNDDFGWEVTPSALLRTDGTFSYFQDLQRYIPELELGVGRFSRNQEIEVSQIPPISDSEVAIDFLDSHLTFGTAGDHYALRGDGRVFKFDASSKLPVDVVQLTNDDGTPFEMEGLSGYYARDTQGRLYASFGGWVWVIESNGASSQIAPSLAVAPEVAAKLRAGMRAKHEAAATALSPQPAL